MKNILGLILTVIQNILLIVGIWFSSVFVYYTMTSFQNLTHSAKWVCLGISIIVYLVLTWACYKWGFK